MKEKATKPLADRIRPKNLKDFVGQEHLFGPGKPLRRLIENDQITSVILWGPPGSGKTTIARIIALKTKNNFQEFSAVTAGVADIRRVVKEAEERLSGFGQKTILFVDEVHRFNKAQQDAFLPHIEDGTIILIGGTTENPGFEINSALLSRSRLFRLEPLGDKDLEMIVKRALKNKKEGLGSFNLKINKKALEYLTKFSNGDARVTLNVLEIAALNAKRGSIISLKDIEDIISKKALKYDKAGDQHYDTISAFIKSMRGSDPDASVYYLARMIESGEDLMFLARRMVIFASEDIGNADPHALILAQNCAQAVHLVGFPEAKLILSQTCLYLATAPKSNAAKIAINEAEADIFKERLDPIPLHLRNAPTKLARKLGHGKGYKYPHNFEGNFILEDYLPKNLKGKKYYRPEPHGYEKIIKERLSKWWRRQSSSE